MNVDKFGHHVHKRLQISKLFDFTDNCLSKKENGVYDLQKSRLTGVKLPVSPNDVASKEYVDNKTAHCISKEEMSTIMESIKTDIQTYFAQLEKKFCTKEYVDKLIPKSQNVQRTSGK